MCNVWDFFKTLDRFFTSNLNAKQESDGQIRPTVKNSEAVTDDSNEQQISSVYIQASPLRGPLR